jgi:hypothetical protein
MPPVITDRTLKLRNTKFRYTKIMAAVWVETDFDWIKDPVKVEKAANAYYDAVTKLAQDALWSKSKLARPERTKLINDFKAERDQPELRKRSIDAYIEELNKKDALASLPACLKDADEWI